MKTQCFLALKTVVDQLQGELTPGNRRRLQKYVLAQLPLAGLSAEQFQAIEHWLKGGIASRVNDLGIDAAGAVLHYFEVGLNEYLGPDAATLALEASFANATQRLAGIGINPRFLLYVGAA
jgi:hypothetical protein